MAAPSRRMFSRFLARLARVAHKFVAIVVAGILVVVTVVVVVYYL